MDLPTITISSKAIKEALTELINEYIRIEKSEKSFAYQQKSNFVCGQIALITSFIDEKWDFNNSGQIYYDYLKYIVEKYDLTVWRINDLQ